MDRRVIFVALCLVTIPWAMGDNQECQNFVEPHHAIDDGHAHWHHLGPADGHMHGDEWFPDGHTHSDHAYCNQVGMVRVPFQDAAPLEKISLEDAVVGTEPSVIIGDEAYTFDTQKTQARMTLGSDMVLGAMGFPGSGTESDPYIISGYHFTERLTLANTDACVVIRDNLITGSFLEGPMVNPVDIVDLNKQLQDAKTALELVREALVVANEVVQLDRELVSIARADWIAFQEGRQPYLDDVRAANLDVQETRESYLAAHEERDALKAAYRDAKANLESQTGITLPDGPQLGLEVEEFNEPDLDALAADAQALYDQWRSAIDNRAEALDALRAAKDLRMTERDELLAYDEGKDAALEPLLDAKEALAASVEARAPVQASFVEAKEVRDQWRALASQGDFLWADIIFDTIEELTETVLEEADQAELQDAQLVLDWNGQCVHAYNNIVDDLRVNQNNARTGYATGGLIEDNRIFDVGQLRHYDGVFRENEVGNLDQLQAFQSSSDIAADRAANVDGFNQGLIEDNIFYGFVDLDLHGHHHGAGFYAPESHYHGDGEPKHRHDHTQRWTSVQFKDNLVIDPANYGLRYEDRNHEGDDRTANSETVFSLNLPHVHRTQVDIIENVIVGSIFVDEFNADGVLVWSDTLEDLRIDQMGRIQDAILHVGATILNTHPERNDGWLTIADNVIFHTNNGRAALDILDLKEANVTLADNIAYAVDNAAVDTDSSPATTGDGTGLRLQRIKDAAFDICGNAFHGFDAAFEATKQVMEDVSIATCSSNTWDGTVNVAFTEYEEEELTTTSLLREATEGTVLEASTSIVFDEIDKRSRPVDNQLQTVATTLGLS